MKRRGWRSIPSQPRDRLAEFITATVESLDHGLVAPHQAFLGRGALPHRRGRGGAAGLPCRVPLAAGGPGGVPGGGLFVALLIASSLSV